MASNRDHYHTDDMVIHLKDAYDVQLWSLVFGASETDVLSAANKVGTDARAVQEELNQRRSAKPTEP